MANHKSSKKRMRQTIVKNLRNKIRRSEVRTLVKSLRAAISSSNKDEAAKLLPGTQKAIDKLASSGVIKKENASRKNARLASQVAKL